MQKIQKFIYYFVASLAVAQFLMVLSTYPEWGVRDRSWLSLLIAGVWLCLRQDKIFKK